MATCLSLHVRKMPVNSMRPVELPPRSPTRHCFSKRIICPSSLRTKHKQPNTRARDNQSYDPVLLERRYSLLYKALWCGRSRSSEPVSPFWHCRARCRCLLSTFPAETTDTMGIMKKAWVYQRKDAKGWWLVRGRQEEGQGIAKQSTGQALLSDQVHPTEFRRVYGCRQLRLASNGRGVAEGQAGARTSGSVHV